MNWGKTVKKSMFLVVWSVLAVSSQVVVDLDNASNADSTKERTYPSTDVSCSIGFNAKKIIKSTAEPTVENPLNDTNYLNGMWMQGFSGRLSIDVYLTQKFEIAISLDGGIFHGLQTIKYGYYKERKARGRSRGLGATASYLVGNVDNPIMTVKGGYFTFIYQNDSKNLGGYLLRSGTYPGIVYSGWSGVGIYGVGLHSEYVDNLTQDFLINIGSKGDLSPSYLFDYDIAGKGIFNFGAGITYNGLFVADESDWKSDVFYGFKEPLRVDFKTGKTVSRDTIWYDFRGAKAMAKFRFDPKPMINKDIFGDEDLRLYGEAAILGIKNYPLIEDTSVNQLDLANRRGYDKLLDRVPVMVGFVLPTFKLLNYLAVELEWYNSPYRNNISAEPIPLVPVGDRGETDNFKWSVCAAKTFLDVITVNVLAASDHLRTADENGSYIEDERVQKPNEWYISFGVVYNF